MQKIDKKVKARKALHFLFVKTDRARFKRELIPNGELRQMILDGKHDKFTSNYEKKKENW